MGLIEALSIVVSLAEENVLRPEQTIGDPELENVRRIQLDAISDVKACAGFITNGTNGGLE